MATAKAGTTESAGVRRRPRLSVRTRITAVIALLTFLAMAAAGGLVYTLESARIDAAVTEQVQQEIEEFRVLERRGVDPATGERFTDAHRLLTTFLRRNVPDDDEMLVAYRDGEPSDRTPNRYGAPVLEDPRYGDAVAGLLGQGGTARIDIERYGEVWVTAVPVRARGSQGSLVIISFLDDEHAELERTLRTYAIVALLSLGIITGLGAAQSGRLLAPLRTLREAASDISTTDLSRRIPEQGNDDITALTATFNGMLDRLESGVRAQRQFLDDAGHELKTPLTVLRGHLELVDVGDPEELTETKELLLDEVDRMSRLVQDLIVLAKSRRPDFLRPEPVDLESLTRTLLAKARGLGERTWVLDSIGTGTVVVDEQRITQAVLQLADNAVKHTDTGARIVLGSSYGADALRIWVADDGPGIPAAERERIFDRFARATTRSTDEGFGLGLSIVRAIVETHGGTVEVAGPGARAPRVVRGACLMITLPADLVSPETAQTQEARWPTS